MTSHIYVLLLYSCKNLLPKNQSLHKLEDEKKKSRGCRKWDMEASTNLIHLQQKELVWRIHVLCLWDQLLSITMTKAWLKLITLSMRSGQSNRRSRISNQNALIFNKPSNKIPLIFILKKSWSVIYIICMFPRLELRRVGWACPWTLKGTPHRLWKCQSH